MEALAGTVMGAIFGTILGLIVLTLLGFILKALWNSTLPELFGFKTITTWQAIKLLFIASLIFGGNRVISPAPGNTPVTQAEGQAG